MGSANAVLCLIIVAMAHPNPDAERLAKAFPEMVGLSRRGFRHDQVDLLQMSFPPDRFGRASHNSPAGVWAIHTRRNQKRFLVCSHASRIDLPGSLKLQFDLYADSGKHLSQWMVDSGCDHFDFHFKYDHDKYLNAPVLVLTTKQNNMYFSLAKNQLFLIRVEDLKTTFLTRGFGFPQKTHGNISLNQNRDDWLNTLGPEDQVEILATLLDFISNEAQVFENTATARPLDSDPAVCRFVQRQCQSDCRWIKESAHFTASMLKIPTTGPDAHPVGQEFANPPPIPRHVRWGPVLILGILAGVGFLSVRKRNSRYQSKVDKSDKGV